MHNKLYTSINEFKKAFLNEHNILEPNINNVKNEKYKTVFFDYPEFAVLVDNAGKYYVYVYDRYNEEKYSDFLPRTATGFDRESVHIESDLIPLSEVDDKDHIIENYINYHDLELSKFVDEFDTPDALYLIDDKILAELYEYYKGIPFFKQKLDGIFKK